MLRNQTKCEAMQGWAKEGRKNPSSKGKLKLCQHSSMLHRANTLVFLSSTVQLDESTLGNFLNCLCATSACLSELGGSAAQHHQSSFSISCGPCTAVTLLQLSFRCFNASWLFLMGRDTFRLPVRPGFHVQGKQVPAGSQLTPGAVLSRSPHQALRKPAALRNLSCFPFPLSYVWKGIVLIWE